MANLNFNLSHARKLGLTYGKGITPNTKTGVRYILCDNASSNWGKSTLLRDVADYYLSLPQQYKCIDIYPKLKNDRWIVVEEIATGKIIMIQTKGDDLGCFSRSIKFLLSNKYTVDIFICACHPSDFTQTLVKSLANKSFQLYFFQNFFDSRRVWALSASAIVKDELKDSIVRIVNQL